MRRTRIKDGPVTDTYDTAMDLLNESAAALERAAEASGDEADTSSFRALSARISRYLMTSRPTTPLGMPHIAATGKELSADMVVRRSEGERFGHVRIVTD